MNKIKAFAPATVANLGVGFDVMGMAIEGLGDYVTVEFSDEPGVHLVEISGDGGKLSTSPDKNTAVIAAKSVLQQLGSAQGIRLWLEKRLPLSSGLGSSAASAVAAAVAVNELLGNPLLREDLLPAVLDAEEAVSGRHADNVAPSLLGGIVLITGISAAQIHRLPVPHGIYLSLVTPDVEVPTAKARALLPAEIPLNLMVQQTGAIAELVHALHSGDIHLLASAMERDRVVEPAREPLIPHLREIREVARQVGALVTVISGSGPTLCSICITHSEAEAVSNRIVAAYHERNLGSQGFATAPAQTGARIIHQQD